MKRNRNYVKIFVANIISMLLMLFLIADVWIVLLLIKDQEIFRLPNALIFVFVDFIIYCIMNMWKNWIVLEKCDFEAQEAYVLKLLSWKRYKWHVGLHLGLLYTSLILGRYDESRQEIEVLYGLNNRLNNRQKLQLQLYHIDYMISAEKTESLEKELEDAKRGLEQLNNINGKVRQKIQKSIQLRWYIIEERWEDILELLKDTSKSLKNVSVLEQIIITYIRGACRYRLGRYEEAFNDLRFVESKGGNTKYVALANDLIERMPEKNLYKDKYTEKSKRVKHGMRKTEIFLVISCFMVLLLGFVSYHFSHGSSIEETYCRRYLCAENELSILYQEDIDNYELVVLGEAEKIAYCLFKETSNSNYTIIHSFRIGKNTEDYQTGLMGIELTKSEKEFYQKGEIRREVWAIITGFYQGNDIFYKEDLAYVGISYSPMVENVIINGSPISVKQIINIDGMPAYIWSVEHVDLERQISVDYMGR